MHRLKIYVISLAFLSACKPALEIKKVLVKNNLDFDREEVVTVKLSILGDLPEGSTWIVKSGGDISPSQLIDVDGNSIKDELLFLANINANEEKIFVIEYTKEEVKSEATNRTHSRFVPERIDDYAWENDRVAFRTYGPEAQRLVEVNEKGGTLSSGMDCWLKRVDYPIINKWYKKYVDGASYHKDDGEGYDPYHVGGSRGCGGVGVWKNDSLYVSKNFVTYKKIMDGPVRNIFELTYAPWQADGTTVEEKKRITIDLGNQLYKVEEHIQASDPLPNITIGITLHEGKGVAQADSANGTFSYWEPIDDSELGTGVVIDPAWLLSYQEYRTAKKDQSHLYIMAKPEQKIIYHTGFAWKKAGAIQTLNEWNSYLDIYAQRLRNPVRVITQ